MRPDEALKQAKEFTQAKFQELKEFTLGEIKDHIHDGNFSQRVNFFDIFGYTEPVNATSGTIATTGNTDAYILAPRDMTLVAAYFSATAALATSDVNYITWTITNLGQAGAGTAAMLSTADSNTTKTTGGSAIAANTKRTLILSATPANLQVIEGDRLLIRAGATGTLANTVTFPNYLFIFQ